MRRRAIRWLKMWRVRARSGKDSKGLQKNEMVLHHRRRDAVRASSSYHTVVVVSSFVRSFDRSIVRRVSFSSVPSTDPLVRLRHDRHRPVAVILHAEVVHAADNLEPAGLAPVRPPRVPTDPVLRPVLGRSVPRDGDDVILLRAPGRVLEHAAGVGFELGGDAEAARDRSSRRDLRHHLLFAGHRAVLADVIHPRRGLLDRVAPLVVRRERRLARLTLVHSAARHVLGLVVLARLVGDAVL
mmetsp:Transcript_3962/g.13799  ORF Transcript_3962/g.13799 Transcript_3962/m.13799 type:complete len:241 (+) Transcript_3962:612-1334(+)